MFTIKTGFGGFGAELLVHVRVGAGKGDIHGEIPQGKCLICV